MTDKRKLQSAIAYLAGKLQPGKVKLFKLLYLADFTARAELGRSITTDTYENFEMGPVPVTLWRQFKTITRDCVTISDVDTGVIPEQQMRPKRGFRPILSTDERVILDRVVAKFGHMSGNQLREYTHETIPYLASKRGDTIPYGLAPYLEYDKPSRAELDMLVSDERLIATLKQAVARA